jgi:hypothetical protein
VTPEAVLFSFISLERVSTNRVWLSFSCWI